MYPERLEPNLKLLRKEFVLVQAWKKTAAHIRQRSWTVDSLVLDYASVNLPKFIRDIRKRLRSGDTWENKPLRLVMAPKNQEWRVTGDSWEPENPDHIAEKMRPLAYVNLEDQVIATAVMLCLADRVESRQGDSRLDMDHPENRERTVSYGNRLFCDSMSDGSLRHRWGSAKLYREYYQDYRNFLSRPETVAEFVKQPNRQLVLVKADLQQFYDRVRPGDIVAALDRIRSSENEESFFQMAESVLAWRWHPNDRTKVTTYAHNSKIKNFNHVALPQGLVASGFFANVVLLAFDRELRANFGCNLNRGIRLVDACRYVDDLQILVEVSKNFESSKIINRVVSQWLNSILNTCTSDLKLSPEKTEVIFLESEKRPLLRQRVKMNRIQVAGSGGHDLVEGIEILDGLRGLLLTQVMLTSDDPESWLFSPIPDVRDETVARFSATRFLNTYRSLRPLLEEIPPKKLDVEDSPDSIPTQIELDQDAKVVALMLIERWLKNPSNVRVLLVGLDLWPDVSVLGDILEKLRLYVDAETQTFNEPMSQIAWYCLAEILRAGATQTGFVEESESFPGSIDLAAYRRLLGEEAVRLVALPEHRIPWYLRQQALLFLITFDPTIVPEPPVKIGSEIALYWRMVLFMRGEGIHFSNAEFATFAVMARRSFLNQTSAAARLLPWIKPSHWDYIVRRDPSFCFEVLKCKDDVVRPQDVSPRVKYDLCLFPTLKGTLADVVLNTTTATKHPLRDELSLLNFTRAFLELLESTRDIPEVITPTQISVEITENLGFFKVTEIEVRGDRRLSGTNSLYAAPLWCRQSKRWRFQLGFLLRFILTGQRDFSRPVRDVSWREDRSCYRPVESHWYQRIHGMYSAQSSFGDDWLPVTEWVEEFLLALLSWPGCQIPTGFEWVTRGIPEIKKQIEGRIADLEKRRGKTSNLLILPMQTKRRASEDNERSSLRICVAQTAIPSASTFSESDLTLDNPAVRREHRNHLSATLSAVKRMLKLRETHKNLRGKLDLLVLPELAVHPKDVQMYLTRFATAYKTMILAGLTYEQIFPNQPSVNSALWIIPEWSDASELRIRMRRQGKANLAPNEQDFNGEHIKRVMGFRPCQWLIGYPMSDSWDSERLWFTAAVCYDATDLALVTDLRHQSDVLAIPALNKDVKTFDQMALALHYHMFQLVILANNGQYGGSNAYWPKGDVYERQIFHFHGQSQANVFFFEIDDVKEFKNRFEVSVKEGKQRNLLKPDRYPAQWKYPPAGLKDKH